ncbi:unnamed protein product, partial [marine sediment metagenome]
LTYESLDYNFRMDELSAALGCSKMEGLRRFYDY